MSTQAGAFKAALFTACGTLYTAPTQVSYGHPGSFQSNENVWLGNVTSRAALATISPLRRREEILELTGIIRVYVAGGPESQQTASERAYALLSQLDTYLDDSGAIGSTQITLGNVVRWSLLTAHDLQESDDPAVLARGRIAELTFVVSAAVRI